MTIADFSQSIAAIVKRTKQVKIGLEELLKYGRNMQIPDKDNPHLEGYTTKALQNIHVATAFFKEFVHEFPVHKTKDCWPPEHPASGLPIDGVSAALNPNGCRVNCAFQLIGLPLVPLTWDGVGTHHMATSATSYAFQKSNDMVIVRTDGGTIQASFGSTINWWHSVAKYKTFACSYFNLAC